MSERWIERREFHRDAPGLRDLVGDHDRSITSAVAVQRVAAAPGDWSDADRLWDRFLTNGTRLPAFRLVRDGVTLSRSATSRKASIGHQRVDDLVDPNHVLEAYTAGATVVLQALQFSDPAYARLSTNLALALDQPVQVNAYLSPRAARGLDVHFDFHDVVTVQLEGRKRWRVWKPVARTERPLKRGPAIAQPSVAELGTPIVDRVVAAGDALIVPRGFPHAAETVEEHSVHLTIGLMAITWNRLLRDRIDQVASGTALAERVAVSGGGSDEVLKALSRAIDPVEVRRAIATDVWQRQPQTRLRPRHRDCIEADDPVVVTPGPLLWVDERPAGPRGKHALMLGDRRLRFPAECSRLVTNVLGSVAPFTARSIDASLDTRSRLVVLQRLAVEGVVTRA